MDLGREAYERRAWREAYGFLAAASRSPGLLGEDLERLAIAANLIDAEDWVDRWADAYRVRLESGSAARAARCAGWLAYGLFNSGQVAQGGGWLARAHDAIEHADEECAERGLLLVLHGVACCDDDPGKAAVLFADAAAIGRRSGDRELMAMAQMGQGQAAVVAGDCRGALPSLDSAMLIVSSEKVSPLVQGVVFCGVIDACQRALELRRAAEWTAVLTRWCDEQPDLVPFRGQCLVHRAEMMQLHGDWDDALEEARRARSHLDGTPLVGEAAYREAELHRLRGSHADADACYRAAADAGRDPQPGLALLRLAQGRVDAASAAIRRAVLESWPGAPRVPLLAAAIEILLAAGDTGSARSAADELTSIAADLDVPFARALACMGEGRVRLAAGDAEQALRDLRRAWRFWRDLSMPYEAARGRFLLGLACRSASDSEAAAMEFDAARLGFANLGASADLVALERAAQLDGGPRPGGLSPRELEVLALIADGHTNREIAATLIVSEHTVARHVQNIFAKLDVSSRTAAAAFAHQHVLL
ncbi:MAG: LuxR C-terminal-related transcriptional regulator [Candidatus Limnocylindrales bacterium]